MSRNHWSQNPHSQHLNLCYASRPALLCWGITPMFSVWVQIGTVLPIISNQNFEITNVWQGICSLPSSSQIWTTIEFLLEWGAEVVLEVGSRVSADGEDHGPLCKAQARLVLLIRYPLALVISVEWLFTTPLECHILPQMSPIIRRWFAHRIPANWLTQLRCFGIIASWIPESPFAWTWYSRMPYRSADESHNSLLICGHNSSRHYNFLEKLVVVTTPLSR